MIRTTSNLSSYKSRRKNDLLLNVMYHDVYNTKIIYIA